MTVEAAPAEQLFERIRAALGTLGTELLATEHNGELRATLATRAGAERCWHSLLRCVHRVVWCLKAEASDLVRGPDFAGSATAAPGITVLLGHLHDGANEASAWRELSELFRLLASGDQALGVPAFGGLFREHVGCPLQGTSLGNDSVAQVLAALGASAQTAPVWRTLSFEQFGAAYEELLEYEPEFDLQARRLTLRLREDKAHSRRRRGSYYTPQGLIETVLDGALETVVNERLAQSEDLAPRELEGRLLQLSVIDPACGSGNFLVAAARRLARRLTALRGSSEHPGPTPSALASVITHCVYGIDLDPIARELCISTLWFEAHTPGLSLDPLYEHVLVGNALLGVDPNQARLGPVEAAWRATEQDAKPIARGLRQRDEAERARSERDRNDALLEPSPDDALRLAERASDAWCAAFLCAKASAQDAARAPTHAAFFRHVQRGQSPASHSIEQLRLDFGFVHWPIAFAGVFAAGGFDLVLGNPPWIAHAGRAAQALPPRLKAFFQHQYEAFADYPTTHGMFISAAARALREGGALGLVIPSSVSELDGYEPTRRAHDRLCAIESELRDFGEGQFEGVTQPCMALISRRRAEGRGAELGQAWPMLRPDLDQRGRALLQRLSQLPQLPASLFGERGVQSDKALRAHFVAANAPRERFTTAIREGSDVREFQLLAPRLFVDREALGARMRSSDQFANVRIVVRQTARYPIAALSDGQPFRNSLLAAFETHEWPAPALVALLNSSLIRWLHYTRFRDARQPILPQLKISHLRAIPRPPRISASSLETLGHLGQRLSTSSQPGTVRAELDALVHDLYGVEPDAARDIDRWHATVQHAPRARRAPANP